MLVVRQYYGHLACTICNVCVYNRAQHSRIINLLKNNLNDDDDATRRTVLRNYVPFFSRKAFNNIMYLSAIRQPACVFYGSGSLKKNGSHGVAKIIFLLHCSFIINNLNRNWLIRACEVSTPKQ